jgi:hypothetical protein
VIKVTIFDPMRTRNGLVPGVRGSHYSLTLDQFAKAMTARRDVPSKSENKLWSPATFEGNRRRMSEATEVSSMAFDFDDGLSFDDAVRYYTKRGCRFFAHTSYSHSPDHEKLRIVIPLAQPCPAQFYPRAWEYLAHRSADRQARDISRAFYLPSARNPEHYRSQDVPGPLLTLEYDRLPLTPAELRRSKIREAYSASPRNQNDPRDPRNREELAHRLGARISTRSQGTVAHGMTCPACGRPSVWFAIESLAVGLAMCGHRESCDWKGSLSAL